MLHLIKMWLTAPVEETDEKGRRHRNTRNRDEGRGSPQGSPISPLLSNLCMRRFVLGWKKLGHERRLGASIVNYADDPVICCRGRGEEALAAMRVIMTKLKLTVNETKTRVAKLPEERFDFLGYTFGRCYSPKTGRAYPSARRRYPGHRRAPPAAHSRTAHRLLEMRPVSPAPTRPAAQQDSHDSESTDGVALCSASRSCRVASRSRPAPALPMPDYPLRARRIVGGRWQ